ncbi:hypothetical protein ACVOMS_10920 [Bradyrhizobium guangxiense]
MDNQREAEIEAASSLADMARELDPFASSEDLAIEALGHRSSGQERPGRPRRVHSGKSAPDH